MNSLVNIGKLNNTVTNELGTSKIGSSRTSTSSSVSYNSFKRSGKNRHSITPKYKATTVRTIEIPFKEYESSEKIMSYDFYECK